MIELGFFEDDADEARRVLEAMSRLASERTGHVVTFSLVAALDDHDAARVMEVQADAFGRPDAAFTARDLDEVRADPEALFLRCDVDGRLEGCAFGYWEWPDQITVPGTDFFLDSAMISAAYRGRGVGKVMVAGGLLLVDLLECRRVGMAAWMGGPRPRNLLRFYRSFGFRRVIGRAGRNAPMILVFDDEKLARYLAQIELEPDGWSIPRPGRVWPRADERSLLGRFYLAMGLAEALFLVAPFEFAYLYLTLDRPDWAVIVTMAGSLAAIVAAIPAGVIADRGSRKIAVLAGGVLLALGLFALPPGVRREGSAQLVAACAAFAIMGVGEAMLSGATEAWVVDNLHASGRPDLVDTFFGRLNSVAAAGAATAAMIALALLLAVPMRRGLLDLLWIVGGIGFLVGTLIMLGAPERRRPGHMEDDEGPARFRLGQALRALAGRRALLMIVAAVVLGAGSGAAAQEAFTVALITRQFDARLFAPLGVVDSLIGAVGPILGLALARRMGASRMLALVLGLEGALVALLFAGGGIAILLVLYVGLDLLDDSWDPVAIARMQALTPSAHRATISSLVYQFGAIAELAGIGAFGLLLGRNREAIEQATPDLVEAFSGVTKAAPSLPAVWLGLPVPELAIALFVLVGVLGLPLVLASGRRRSATAPTR